MVFYDNTIGDFSWICLKEFDFNSLCTQRSIVETINLLFVFIFYTSLFIIYIRRFSTNGGNHIRNLFFNIASIFSALIGIASISIGLWNNLIASTGNTKNLSLLLSCIIRGFVWISFSASLLVQRNKCIKILNSIWWICSCVLVSALNIEILFKDHSIEVFDVVQWLVQFLILLCALQNLGCFVTQSDKKYDENLSEPLISQRSENKKTGLCNANIVSKLIFSWVNPLLRLGYSRPLSLEDIPSLAPEDEAESAYQNFVLAWESLTKKNNNTKKLVLWSVVRVYLKENMLIAFYALIRTICVVVSPLILYAFVNYSNSTDPDLKYGFLILGFLIVTKVFESLSQRHMFFDSRRSGMKMRSALMIVVYQKQLRLSSLARYRHSTGEIVNYIAIDAYRMGEFPWWFHIAWTSALQLVLSIGVLFCVVGLGALPGIVPFIICGFLNVPYAKILQNCQSQITLAQDERLRSTSEILNSMKIIKLQSWEEKFKSIVNSLRAKEFIWLSKARKMKAVGSFIYWMCPTIVSSVVFLGCVLFHSAPLDAGTIFTVLATLRILSEPVWLLPEALSILIQVVVSFDRLNTFLLDEELKNDDNVNSVKHGAVNGNDNNNAVEIQGGNFTWDKVSVFPILSNVNLEVKWGQKVAVCGPFGGGKSSLLHAIL